MVWRLAMTDARHTAETGIDLVEIDRVRRLLQENPAAWQGMSTRRERQCWRGVAGAACVLAAKEALLKALQGPGADEVDWQQMEVLPGPPLQIALHGELADWARQHRPGRWLGTAAAGRSLALAWVMWLPQEGSGAPLSGHPDSFR